jgi:hypothetical protein
MFQMSNMVIILLQKYLKQFGQDGVAKVLNKDVCVCLEPIVVVCVQLAEEDALLHKARTKILEGFTHCFVIYLISSTISYLPAKWLFN